MTTVLGVRVTDQADGAVTITAHQRYTITIAAEDRAPLAAAILPAPPTDAVRMDSEDQIGATMYDSAFSGPSVAISTAWNGHTGCLAPDAAEQLAAQLLDAAAQARTRIAEIEGAQDRACDTPAEPYTTYATGREVTP